MTNILQRLENEILIMDGGMGTLLIEQGVGAEICFETLNIDRPEIIKNIHNAYVEAGAEIIETNTFGGNRFKLQGYGLEDKIEELNIAGVRLAKEAAKRRAYLCASMGPTGKLLEPMGQTSFDAAYAAFAQQAKIFEKAGADLISVETITDIQEMRAAVIAIKQNTKLPVIASLSYEPNGKTITGTDPKAAVVILEALGADIISANCSNGPKEMLPIARELVRFSRRPVMVMPNAGMPNLIEDKPVYDMQPDEFAAFAKQFAKFGIRIIGGCCGTTPAHIKAARSAVPRKKSAALYLSAEHSSLITKLASRTQVVEAGEGCPFLLIGERINPTARKSLAEELKRGSMQMVRAEAISQVEAGAAVLDVNVSVPEIDDAAVMQQAVNVIQNSVSAPLCIDSSNPAAIESGLMAFVGKALINSVSGEEKSLETILPLAKKYGAAIIGLTLDEKGIPKTAPERVKIAQRIVKRAYEYGIPKEDIFIDVLVLSMGAEQDLVRETLRAVWMVKNDLRIKTSLGVSNLSHGLPNRPLLNRTFLAMNIASGLDAAILNPADPEIHKAILAAMAIMGQDRGCREFIKMKDEGTKGRRDEGPRIDPVRLRRIIRGTNLSIKDKIKQAVINGDKENVLGLIETALKEFKAQEIIDQGLLLGIEIVGEHFSRGEFYLPQVMAAAEVMKLGFERLKKEIKPEEQKVLGTAVIATVQGDIHDIGKNIVAMLLTNHGFRVVDLGKDVASAKIIEAVKKESADIVLLSALLTTTMVQMKHIKEELKAAGIAIPVLIGGAVVTEEYASKINANFAANAIESVRVVKNLLRKN